MNQKVWLQKKRNFFEKKHQNWMCCAAFENSKIGFQYRSNQAHSTLLSDQKLLHNKTNQNLKKKYQSIKYLCAALKPPCGTLVLAAPLLEGHSTSAQGMLSSDTRINLRHFFRGRHHFTASVLPSSKSTQAIVWQERWCYVVPSLYLFRNKIIQVC